MPLALERFKEVGFVDLHHARELGGLDILLSQQEPVPPTKGGGCGHLQAFRCLPDAHAIDHAFAILDVLLRLAKPSQRGACQSIEALGAVLGLALESRAPILASSLGKVHASAVRTGLDRVLGFTHDQRAFNLPLADAKDGLDFKAFGSRQATQVIKETM